MRDKNILVPLFIMLLMFIALKDIGKTAYNSNYSMQFISNSAYAENAEVIIEPDNAVKAYEDIIKSEPENPENYKTLGTLYYEMGETSKGIVCYQKAIALEVKQNKDLFKLAQQNVSGRTYLAIQYLNKLSEIEPDRVEVYNNLGWCYFGIGDDMQALRNFKIALRLNPKNSESIRGIIKTYEALDNQELKKIYSDMLKKVDSKINTITLLS